MYNKHLLLMYYIVCTTYIIFNFVFKIYLIYFSEWKNLVSQRGCYESKNVLTTTKENRHDHCKKKFFDDEKNEIENENLTKVVSV